MNEGVWKKFGTDQNYSIIMEAPETRSGSLVTVAKGGDRYRFFNKGSCLEIFGETRVKETTQHLAEKTRIVTFSCAHCGEQLLLTSGILALKPYEIFEIDAVILYHKNASRDDCEIFLKERYSKIGDKNLVINEMPKGWRFQK